MGKAEKALRPHDIDAFWLQRELRKYYDDPMTAQTKANEVLQILKVIGRCWYFSFFFFCVVSHFYVGSMCLMRCLRLTRSCATSPDSSLSLTRILVAIQPPPLRSSSPSFTPQHLHHHQRNVLEKSRFRFPQRNVLEKCRFPQRNVLEKCRFPQRNVLEKCSSPKEMFLKSGAVSPKEMFLKSAVSPKEMFL